MSRKGWLLFAAMCLIWGIPYLLIRVAVRDVSPAFLVCARTGLGGLLLLPFALAKGGFRVLLPLLAAAAGVRRRRAGDCLAACSAMPRPSCRARCRGCWSRRCRWSAWSSPGSAATSRRIEPVRLVGLLMGFGGVAALVGLDLGELDCAGVIELAVVVIGYAIGPVIQARWLADLPSYSVVVGLAADLSGSATCRSRSCSARPMSRPGPLASIIVLGTVCTAVAFVVFFALIAEVGPARAVVFTYVNPAVAVLLGVIWLNETFTVGMAVGFPLILVGCVLAATAPAAPDRGAVAPTVVRRSRGLTDQLDGVGRGRCGAAAAAAAPAERRRRSAG